MDLLLISVPGEKTYSIPAAPALLTSAVINAGFSCNYIDYNIKFKNGNYKNFEELENYFITGINLQFLTQAIDIINIWVDEIISLNPKFIGISVFTYQNRIATELFCKVIKERTNIKIILGGQGISDGGIEGKKKWVNDLKNKGLLDYWITSEGEISLVELLKGNINHIGINSENFLQIDDLNTINSPNYDYYVFSDYKVKYLPVLSSRGCVRECTFCDVHEHWKYRYKKGENVAKELIMLSEKYKIDYFYFSDSLVNGNLKEFKNFCNIMAEYNEKNNNKIQWLGQFIVRSKKTLSENYWETISKAGAKHLVIGIESGSEKVRQHMKKFFTNEDIDYTLEMLKKYNIKCSLLFMVGYPTETLDDYNKTIEMFEKYKIYIDNTITDISLGHTLELLPNTWLYKNVDKMNLILDEKYPNNWFPLDNSNYDIIERFSRLKKAYEYTENAGYNVEKNHEYLNIIERNLVTYQKVLKVKKRKLGILNNQQ